MIKFVDDETKEEEDVKIYGLFVDKHEPKPASVNLNNFSYTREPYSAKHYENRNINSEYISRLSSGIFHK